MNKCFIFKKYSHKNSDNVGDMSTECVRTKHHEKYDIKCLEN